MKSWVPISKLAGPFKFSEQWVPGCTCTPLLYTVFTGLAQFARALGNGHRQALGEEVELSRLKRKAPPSFESSLGGGGSLMAKKDLVDLRLLLVAKKTVKEKPPFKHPLNVSQHSVEENLVKENLVKEKESFFQKVPLEESSSQALSQGLSGFSQELSVLSQNGDSLNPLPRRLSLRILKVCQSGVPFQGWCLAQGEYVEGWLAKWCAQGWCGGGGRTQI